jgi:hypothetical protein
MDIHLLDKEPVHNCRIDEDKAKFSHLLDNVLGAPLKTIDNAKDPRIAAPVKYNQYIDQFK